MDATIRIALLIDADNAPAAKVETVLSELARHGIANVRRAYGNWKNPNLRAWEDALHPHAIQPIQQFAYSLGKNASDMAMVSMQWICSIAEASTPSVSCPATPISRRW